jgi:hypothetical protein
MEINKKEKSPFPGESISSAQTDLRRPVIQRHLRTLLSVAVTTPAK